LLILSVLFIIFSICKVRADLFRETTRERERERERERGLSLLWLPTEEEAFCKLRRGWEAQLAGSGHGHFFLGSFRS